LDDHFRDQWEQAKKDGNTIAAVGIWLSYQKYGSTLGINARTKSGILLGRADYGQGYWQAQVRQRAWQRAMQAMLEKVNFIALPTLETTPPRITVNFRIGILDARMLGIQDTVPVNLAGNPALSVPVPLSHDGFPVAGLQLIGPLRGEAELLNAGRLVEEALHK
jgi:amidase